MRPVSRKILAILGVGLVFALGMVAGGAVTVHFLRHRAEALLTRHGSDLATERLARHLADDLHCDASQREQVAAILRSAHGEMWEVRSEAAPRVRDIYRRAVDRLRGTLRPDQVKVLDKLVARQMAVLHMNEDAPSPPPSSTPPSASATPTPARP